MDSRRDHEGLPDPLISFTTLTPGGIEHVTSVCADDTALFLITVEAFVTDSPSPSAYLFDAPSDQKTLSEFADVGFANLPRIALQLMAGHRALEETLKFRDGYLPFEAWLDLDEPEDDGSGFDDDDGMLDDGVFL
jgi:hypothetical protein